MLGTQLYPGPVQRETTGRPEPQEPAPALGQRGHSLLDLVAAVGASVADDKLQLLAGVLHKLTLEGPLLGLGGPRQALVDIQEAIESKGEGDEPPAHRLPHLQRHSDERTQTLWVSLSILSAVTTRTCPRVPVQKRE